MQKQSSLLLKTLGLFLALIVTILPCFHYDDFRLNLLFGALGGVIFYIFLYKKLDFDDGLFYALVAIFITLSFGIKDVVFIDSFNLLIYLFAYLLGSVPFGLLLAKSFANVDIKELGSKSIGATNVLRVVKQKDAKLAQKLAVATFLLDFSKAFVPILLAKLSAYDANLLYSIGVFVILGHCFSIYLHLQGGKGIATGAGVMAVLLPLELAIALVVWFIIGKVFKISSLASLCATLTFLISLFFIHQNIEINTYAPIFIICFIVFYKHKDNIKRLIFKQECKVI